MTEARLTAESDLRTVLLAILLDEYGEDAETWTALGSLTRITAAIERYSAACVAAALAPVEALADEWEATQGRSRIFFLTAADELRAAMTTASSEAAGATGGGDRGVG